MIIICLQAIALFGHIIAFPQTLMQEDRRSDYARLHRDPTYSIHNYKHANKATVAHRWEPNAGILVHQQSTQNRVTIADYRPQQQNAALIDGSIVVPVGRAVNPRSYKAQNLEPKANSTGPLAPANGG